MFIGELYMDDMNVQEINYKNYCLIIKVVGKKKVCGFELAILSVDINRNNYFFSLGNFYTKIPQLVNDNYLKKFAKNFIDNIDKIIFENNRYIGNNSKIKDYFMKSSANSALGEIYSEFLSMSKGTLEYIKYSRFLELYFNGHSIPDSIRKLYLEKSGKCILDFDDVDGAIKSEFCGFISELKDEDEYEYNVKCLKHLNEELKFKEEEINLLVTMINKIKSILNELNENDKINTSIDELESKLKEISFFDKSRKEIKGTLKSLVNSLNLIDEEKMRKELYELYSHYASIYQDTRGLLLLFDNLSLEDILLLLEDVYKNKEASYNDMLVKRDNLNNEISNYKDNSIDISDLYERLE